MRWSQTLSLFPKIQGLQLCHALSIRARFLVMEPNPARAFTTHPRQVPSALAPGC